MAGGEQRVSKRSFSCIPSSSIPASAPAQILRPSILMGAPVPGATKAGAAGLRLRTPTDLSLPGLPGVPDSGSATHQCLRGGGWGSWGWVGLTEASPWTWPPYARPSCHTQPGPGQPRHPCSCLAGTLESPSDPTSSADLGLPPFILWTPCRLVFWFSPQM